MIAIEKNNITIAVNPERMNMEELRQQFRSLRQQRKLTQKQVAQMLNITQASISSFELGKNKTMRKKTLQAIARMVNDWNLGRNIVPFSSRATNEHPAPSQKNDAASHYLDKEPSTTDHLLQCLRESLIRTLAEGGDPIKAQHAVNGMTPKQLFYNYVLSTNIPNELGT